MTAMYAREAKTVESPPMTKGFARSAIASTKRRRNEAAKPGISMGRVTVRKIFHEDAPREAAASSIAGSRFLSMPSMFMYATGKKERERTRVRPERP